MIAKIKTNALTVYDSVVFAFTDEGFNSKIIAFDRKLETLIILPLFDETKEELRTLSQQNYTILDAAIDGFERVGEHTFGYPWIIGDHRLLGKIDAKEPLPADLLEKCHALQDGLALPEWTEITDEVSATNLLWASDGFHDGTVREITREGNRATITIETWAGDVQIQVENAFLSPEIEACEGAFSSFGQIWSGHIYFWGDRIYFVDAMGDVALDDLGDDWLYFSGTRMCWKIDMD